MTVLNIKDKNLNFNTLCFSMISSLLRRSSLNSFFVSVCYKSK